MGAEAVGAKVVIQFDRQGNIVRELRYGDLRPHIVCPDCFWHHGWHWPTCPSTTADTCPDWCEMAPGHTDPPAASDGTIGRWPVGWNHA
jgi:hypothetical protein